MSPHSFFSVVIYIVFEDLGRKFSGRSIWVGVWSESKPRLLNKRNCVPGTPPSAKGLRPDFTTKTECAEHLQRVRMILHQRVFIWNKREHIACAKVL